MARVGRRQSDMALRNLRSMVLNGTFAPGERLSEPALSELLGISRTPLREAKAKLLEEGLLQKVASGGFRVSSYSMRDISDAIETRGAIEGLAARLAAERGVSATGLDACRAILNELDHALNAKAGVDFDGYVLWNSRFHDWLACAADSPIIEREVARATSLPLASPSAFLRGQEDRAEFLASLSIAQHQHRIILEAIEFREGARAEAAAREHARHARANLKYAVESETDLTRSIPGLALVSTD